MGPLHGVRVVELESLAPAPFGCMILADLGAEVIRVGRPAPPGRAVVQPGDPLARGRRVIRLDLKQPRGLEVLLRLAGQADVLVEGFRPGVAERLGFGPGPCLERNPGLVYARMTGWGQDGPLAPVAGHDIDYIAVAGSLDPIGRAGQRPVPPLNLLGDFGGGGMLLAVGVLAALLERERSGQGQVVDAAMVDGAALLATFIHGLRAAGTWRDERGSNLLDGGAPFYDTYQTADGQFIAVGALEPQFYAELLDRLDLDPAALPAQLDRDGWPQLRAAFRARFAERTREEWAAIFGGSDACVAPVMSMADAPGHPHNAARGTFTEVAGVVQPAPAPRFSRTPLAPPCPPGRDVAGILAGLGYPAEEITSLADQGIASLPGRPRGAVPPGRDHRVAAGQQEPAGAGQQHPAGPGTLVMMRPGGAYGMNTMTAVTANRPGQLAGSCRAPCRRRSARRPGRAPHRVRGWRAVSAGRAIPVTRVIQGMVTASGGALMPGLRERGGDGRAR